MLYYKRLVQNLPSVLGPLSIIAAVIGTMIGSGIFIVPSSMAADQLGLWRVGRVMDLAGR